MSNKPNASSTMHSFSSTPNILQLLLLLLSFTICSCAGQNDPNESKSTAQSNSNKLYTIASIFNKDPKIILEVWNNYVTTLSDSLPIITELGGFALDTLEIFIADVRKFFDTNNIADSLRGIGVYPFREDVSQYKLYKPIDSFATSLYQRAGNSAYRQISFVLAPIEFNGHTAYIKRHFIKENLDKIPAYIPGNEGTGLCPPSCK